MYYVKAKVRIHRYLDEILAIFHGPRNLARYNRLEALIDGAAREAGTQNIGLKALKEKLIFFNIAGKKIIFVTQSANLIREMSEVWKHNS